MRTTARLSRRSILGSLAVSPVLASPTLTTEASAGARVLALGRQFDALAAQIDRAIEHSSDITQDVLDQFTRIEAEIVATPATTIDGLRVKARAACWALLGDLDSADRSSTDKRMALSMVRDLIRLHDPNLERIGAVGELVAQATS